MRSATAVLALLASLACASGGGRGRRADLDDRLPRGVRVSEVCGEGDPVPRLRVLSSDPRGEALEDVRVEVWEGPRQITAGTSDQDGSVLFALRAREYTLRWERVGSVGPPPFRVRARAGCEVQVAVEGGLPPLRQRP